MVCIHGVTQHGGVFESFGRQSDADHKVIALDLRGHGASEREPPWDTETHVDDTLETIDALGIDRASFVGHSFGARVTATIAARAPERVEQLVLLDPAFEIQPEYALASAEIDRLDWTFISVDSAVNALMSTKSTVDVSRDIVSAFAADDLTPSPDGRLRFSYSPSAVVVSWSEMTLPPPPIAEIRTLLVRPAASHIDGREQDRRYRKELGPLLTMAAVPKGHNVLWESPIETAAAVRTFLKRK
jgi:lipase